MKRSPLFTLLSSLGIAAVMILTTVLVAWIGRTALDSFEAWQQAFESVRPYLRGWRALLYAASLRSGGICFSATDIDPRIDCA
nr:hypothetical protein [Pseudomonas sp. LG1D9]